MKMFKCAVLPVLAFLVLQAQAALASADEKPFDCMIVSGAKRDNEEKALHKGYGKLIDSDTVEISGHKCITFDSWEDLQTTVSSLKTPERIAIVQVAHGAAGGIGFCNAGPESAEKTLKIIDDISSFGHQIALIDVSCFSGDLLRKKLIADYASKHADDRVCMIVDSYFDQFNFIRSDEAGDLISAVRPGESAEELFSRSNGGMISSALWSQSGLDGFFAAQALKKPEKTLDAINEVCGHCPDEGLRSYSQSCVQAPATESREAKLLAGADKEVTQETLSNFHSRLILESKEGSPAVARCLDTVEKRFIKKLTQGAQPPTALRVYQVFQQERAQVDATCFHGAVPASAGKQSRAQDLLDYAFMLGIPHGDGVWVDRDENHELNNYMPQFVSFDKFTPEFIELLKSAPQTESDHERLGRLLSTGENDRKNPIFGFALGSTAMDATDPLDQARRKACREFKFP